MIHHQRRTFGKRQTLDTEFGRHLHRVAGTCIVHHGKINVGNHDLTGAYWCAARVRGKNFFSDGVSHEVSG